MISVGHTSWHVMSIGWGRPVVMGCLSSRQLVVGKTDLLSHRVLKALVKCGSKRRGADPWERVGEGFLEGLCGMVPSPK